MQAVKLVPADWRLRTYLRLEATALHSLTRLQVGLAHAMHKRGKKQKYEFLFPEFVSSHLSRGFYSDINKKRSLIVDIRRLKICRSNNLRGQYGVRISL